MIDLHCHTTVSDGADEPRALVAKAAAVGLDAIAITDHDNDSGCDDAVDEGDRRDVEVVRGVEISCDVDALNDLGLVPTDRPTMHLLAYFIPAGDNPLSAALADLQYHRANRNRMMVERLNALGVEVTFEEIEAIAGGPGAQIGRPHFAEALVRHGAVPDYQSAFDDYLAKGAKAYISRKLYKPHEACELMVRAGTVPVLAHPFTLNLRAGDLENFVEELIPAGLKGIEGYHGDRTLEEQADYRRLGERKGLIVSGGSDYHGAMRPDRSFPGGRNGVICPDEVLDELRSTAVALQGA